MTRPGADAQIAWLFAWLCEMQPHFLYSGGRAGLMRIPAKNVMPRKHTRGRSPPTVPVIIKLTFVGFSADAGTAAVGVFCELRAYVCGLRSGEDRCVGPLFLYIGR